jgi:ABC-type glycerol-3-phosphate transport system substrate-binding protein
MRVPPLFIVILLVGAFLAGQEIKKLPRPWENNSPITDSITLEFWTLQLRDFKPLIEGWIIDYEEAHPTIEINWVDVPFSEGEKRALSAMMSPHVPDVINLNPAFASTLAERQVLEPIPQAHRELSVVHHDQAHVHQRVAQPITTGSLRVLPLADVGRQCAQSYSTA